MYSRIKPKNLRIHSMEGIDCCGKTVAMKSLQYFAIKNRFVNDVAKSVVRQVCSKYDAPLQTEGSPLSDDYDLYYRIQITNSQSFFQTELESTQQDIQVCQGFGDYYKIFLRLPHQGVPSYEKIRRLLAGDKELNKRYETKFECFLKNYHEAMALVWKHLEERPDTRFQLWSDRSWVSNLVYNSHSALLENDARLMRRLNKLKYHPIDFLTLYLVDAPTLQERLNERPASERSVYEKYGIDYLLKLQDRYIYLVDKLHRLGLVIEYTVTTRESILFPQQTT